MQSHKKFIKKIVTTHKYEYYEFIFAMILSIFFALLSTYISKLVIDSFTYSNGTNNLLLPEKIGVIGEIIVKTFGGADFILNNRWILVIGVIIFGIFTGLTTLYRIYCKTKIETSVSAEVRLKLFYHIERMPYEKIKTINNGDILQTCMRDEWIVKNFFSRGLTSIAYAIVMILLSFLILLSISYKIALVSFAITPILFIYSCKKLKDTRSNFRKADEAEAIVSHKIEENIKSIRNVKAYSNEAYEVDSFEKAISNYDQKFIRWRKGSSRYFSICDSLAFANVALSTIFSCYLSYIGEISAGSILLAITYSTSITYPIRDVASIVTDYAQFIVAIERMDRFYECELEDIEEGLKPHIKGHIKFENVSFNYVDSEYKALANLSFEIKPNSTVAIMGKTGSGKSTLVLLLNRLLDYSSGSIKVDDIELRTISKGYIRQKIAIALQEPYIFSKSIKENLLLSNPDISNEKMLNSAKTAEIDGFISKFPHGYETVIGERGTTLSGGQRQRLAIARTILNESPILILDDSLSAVDIDTDAKIRKALKDKLNNTTSIIITHRTATAKDADLIIVLDDGKIIQQGTHNELIKTEGFYKKIYSMQTRIQ